MFSRFLVQFEMLVLSLILAVEYTGDHPLHPLIVKNFLLFAEKLLWASKPINCHKSAQSREGEKYSDSFTRLHLNILVNIYLVLHSLRILRPLPVRNHKMYSFRIFLQSSLTKRPICSTNILCGKKYWVSPLYWAWNAIRCRLLPLANLGHVLVETLIDVIRWTYVSQKQRSIFLLNNQLRSVHLYLTIA